LGVMKISKRSPFSGEVNEREIDVTPEQIKTWHDGAMIQDAMPDMNPDDREFLMTGITPEEWETHLTSPD
jgi:hypothetical protein